MLVQISKSERNIENFFTRPRGAGARGWKQPDPTDPTSLGDAEKLRETVRKHTESAQQRLNTGARCMLQIPPGGVPWGAACSYPAPSSTVFIASETVDTRNGVGDRHRVLQRAHRLSAR